MKVNSLKIDVSALKPALAAGVRVEDIKKDLLDEGAIVRGYRDGDTVVMVVDGDIDVETVESVFDEYGVNLDDYVIDDNALDIPAYDDVDDDAEIPAYDEVEDVEVFDNADCAGDDCEINEKKGDCCPKKKVNMISLSEVFHGSRKSHKKTLDEVIDHMSGKSVSASVAEAAIAKARLGAKVQMIRENLGEERFARISKALNEGKDSAYENTKINGKAVSEYKLEELEALKKKCDEKLKKLTECGSKDTDECKKLKKLAEILEDEISYRKAKDVAESNGLELKSLNPNDVAKVDEADDDAEDKTDDSEEKKDDSEEKADEENNDDEEKKDDDNDNPDEDEEVEISSIIVTLASKDAAEDLKQDLVDAGVPEDVIEIEPVEGENEESDEEGEKSGEEKNEESDEEKADEENPEESVKHRGNSLNEADDDENADDAEGDEDAEGSDDNDSEDSDETPEGAHKLILTDTDYVNELSDVLENIWGMEHSEFEELIGGEVVAADDSEDGEDNGDEESDAEDADDMDFDPDEIFKDL